MAGMSKRLDQIESSHQDYHPIGINIDEKTPHASQTVQSPNEFVSSFVGRWRAKVAGSRESGQLSVLRRPLLEDYRQILFLFPDSKGKRLVGSSSRSGERLVRQYTPLGMTLTKAFENLKDAGLIVPLAPCPLPHPIPPHFCLHEHCSLHQTQGHTTDYCLSLHNAIAWRAVMSPPIPISWTLVQRSLVEKVILVIVIAPSLFQVISVIVTTSRLFQVISVIATASHMFQVISVMVTTSHLLYVLGDFDHYDHVPFVLGDFGHYDHIPYVSEFTLFHSLCTRELYRRWHICRPLFGYRRTSAESWETGCAASRAIGCATSRATGCAASKGTRCATSCISRVLGGGTHRANSDGLDSRRHRHLSVWPRQVRKMKKKKDCLFRSSYLMKLSQSIFFIGRPNP
uniref:Uncharacterized protein n=1 Tax=Vitis vinifera TaxID=29760 RepID=A5C4Q5_VITVI|nr:hypothetical protein VITISV_029687 [Vitis vinifera]